MQKIKKLFSHISKKQWLTIGIVLLVLIIILIVVSVINNKDEKDNIAKEESSAVNDSAGIIKEATYEGMTINNIILMATNDQSTFTATVTNNSNETKEIEGFDIVLKKGDTKVVTLYAYLGDALKVGESRNITASVGMELTKDVVDTAEYKEHTKAN